MFVKWFVGRQKFIPFGTKDLSHLIEFMEWSLSAIGCWQVIDNFLRQVVVGISWKM